MTGYDRPMEPADLADARADADLLAGRMRRTAERATDALATAAARIYEIRSPGGEVTVSVDGRPRVTAIRVDPRAMRLDPETLGGILTRTVDEALRTARTGTRDELLDTLDPQLREAILAAGPGGGLDGGEA